MVRSETSAGSANVRGGDALVVWGGWDGHHPREAVELFVPRLERAGLRVRVADTLDVYTDEDYLRRCAVIVQCWTQGEATGEQVDGLSRAVAGGAGLAGWHGGLVDAFRTSTDYQLLTGGQWVAHLDGMVTHTVDPVPARTAHPIIAGIEAFELTTEQYYLHVDPSNDVLATSTIVDNEQAPWAAGVVMPQVWTRRWGAGRVFFAAPGHDLAVLRHPSVSELTGRGLLWAAGLL
ncbi:ThuA domain-containing protein [Plantactinospora sp. GCM10030261]|uniref:ThuA domain-containing protein n=1 Tax=Plantactinospora sp. GCM10030261 TaxID=3273420 RepID=UPI00360F846D